MTQPDEDTSCSKKLSLEDTELPQPQNSNHLSTAPLKDKLLTNSSYLAAEIPLKFGHFMSNLWTSSSELSSSFFVQNNGGQDIRLPQVIWLMGRPYQTTSDKMDRVQLDILDAQKSDMFKASNQDNLEEDDLSPDTTALLWPPDFYEDFTSRLWMTYRHNYPPIRPSNHKTDIGWGCMLRSGQSLLANALLIHFLSRGTLILSKVNIYLVIQFNSIRLDTPEKWSRKLQNIQQSKYHQYNINII
jgi:cysteine protease ATG4